MTPGVSEEEAEEGEVSGPDDELIEFCTVGAGTSLRGMDFKLVLRLGNVPTLEPVDGLDSPSSLLRDSSEDRGVPVSSVESNALVESVRDRLTGTSVLGTADIPPPEVDLERLPSLIPDCELLLDVADFFPFGTSPRRNFSPALEVLPFAPLLGEFACCTRVSSLIAGEALADPAWALRMLSLICTVSPAEGCRPFS